MSFIIGVYLNFFIDYTILMYIDYVSKNCVDCSDNLEHNVLKNTTLFSMVFNILNVLSNRNLQLFVKSKNILYTLLGLISIIKFISLFSYINITMKDECDDCTNIWIRRFLYYYSRGLLVLLIFFTLISIYTLQLINK